MPTRRSLAAGALAAAAAFLLRAWGSVATNRRERSARSSRRISLPCPAAEGVTFHGPILLARDAAEVRAFSTRCPHLGCRLSRVEAAELVCPCHGSRFERAGRVVAGPATTGLAPLTAERRADGSYDVLVPG